MHSYAMATLSLGDFVQSRAILMIKGQHSMLFECQCAAQTGEAHMLMLKLPVVPELKPSVLPVLKVSVLALNCMSAC